MDSFEELMKKYVSILLAFLCLPAAAQFRNSYTDLYDSEMIRDMKSQVCFLAGSALEGRKAGSDGEKEAAEYLSAYFESLDIPVVSGKEGQLFGLKQENGDTLRSRNIIGIISGYDKELRDKYIVVGARMDNHGYGYVTINGEKSQKIYFGANGNASGLSVLMQLGKLLSTNKVLLKRSVILAGFGASLMQNAGSWYFLNRGFLPVGSIDAMVNLDMLGIPSRGFYAYTASNTDLNNLIAAQSGTLQPILPDIVTMEPVASDHRSFYAKEIPSVFFTSGMYPEYNSEKDTPSILEYDGMEREVEYLYNFIVALASAPKPEFSQSAKKDQEIPKGVVAYSDCDIPPSFMGSTDPSFFLQKWVYVYVKYPRECVDKGIQGKVLVDFIIDAKGKVKDVKVRRGVHPLLDAEAVKVISVSPDWKPGKVRGQKVSTALSMYVEFRLKK